MLEDCLLESRPSARSRKPLTLVVSVITHGSLAAALILIPLFQEQLLPQIAMFDPLPPPVVHTRVVDLVPKPNQAAASQAAPAPTDLIAPLAIPKEIAHIVDEAIANPGGFIPVGPGGGGNDLNIAGLTGSDLGARQSTPPPPPPSPPPAPPKLPDPTPVQTTPVRQGGDVTLANLVHQVTPEYPLLAKRAGAQGTVLLEAVIMRDGTIDPARIRVLSGHVLLNQAAVEAVKQWRYKPTLLNKVPVEILTTVTLNFRIN